MEKNTTVFANTKIFELCESIMEIHRALKTIGMIFSEFDFDKDNGNAFQGKIQKAWFKSIIDEMVLTQFDRLNQIVDIYNKEMQKL